MAKVLLLIAKSKTGFQSFFLVIYHWDEPRADRYFSIDCIPPIILKYKRINTWPEHIPIHNLLPLVKDRKSEQVGLVSLFHGISTFMDYLMLMSF